MFVLLHVLCLLLFCLQPGKNPGNESPGTPVNFFSTCITPRFFLFGRCLRELAMETRKTFEALLVALNAEAKAPLERKEK